MRCSRAAWEERGWLRSAISMSAGVSSASQLGSLATQTSRVSRIQTRIDPAHINAHLFVSITAPSFSSIRIIYSLLNGPHNTFAKTFR